MINLLPLLAINACESAVSNIGKNWIAFAGSHVYCSRDFTRES